MEKPYNKYYNPKVNQKAVSRYVKNNYDEIKLRIFKGERDILKAYASSLGMSVNNYIRSLLVADGALPEVKKEDKE